MEAKLYAQVVTQLRYYAARRGEIVDLAECGDSSKRADNDDKKGPGNYR